MPVPDDYYVEPNKPKTWTPIPADKYQVMIYDVEAIRELNFKGDDEVDKLKITFVVLDDKKFESENEEGEPTEESTRGRRLWRKIPRSFSPGGKFRASIFYELMCAVEKKEIAKEDLARVQPNSLIGKQIAVFVSVNDSWNNIESFMKVTKDLEPLPTILDTEDGQLRLEEEKPVKGEKLRDEEIEGMPF